MSPNPENDRGSSPEVFDRLLLQLQQDFVLVRKNRAYHLLGGAIAFLLAAFGLSVAGALAAIKTSAAMQAEATIKDAEKEALERLDSLKEAYPLSWIELSDGNYLLVSTKGYTLFTADGSTAQHLSVQAKNGEVTAVTGLSAGAANPKYPGSSLVFTNTLSVASEGSRPAVLLRSGGGSHRFFFGGDLNVSNVQPKIEMRWQQDSGEARLIVNGDLQVDGTITVNGTKVH